MKFKLIMTIVCCVVSACSPAAKESRIRINEVLITKDQSERVLYGSQTWVEVTNSGTSPVRLSDFILTGGDRSWNLPDVTMNHGEYDLLLLLDAARPPTGSETLSDISLMSKSGMLIDSLAIPFTNTGESVGRTPNGRGDFVVFSAGNVTPGAANPDTGFIHKLSSYSAFSPRDSSPNAIVYFKDHYWILGGWSNFGHDIWDSFTQVWKSKDVVTWELVNPTPPYIHYCSFIVWQDRIWAIGEASYSSSDGITWRKEKITVPYQNKSLVFNGKLITLYGSTAIDSRDGKNWFTLTDSAPWGANRERFLLTVFQNKLWVVGGVTDYATPNQKIYNDVWSSSDGIRWEQVTGNAQWVPRMWSSIQVYDGKIFLFNGANIDLWSEEMGNTSEIWFTENGIDWLELKSENIWGARHASLSILDKDGGILMIAGYGGGLSRLYNDVWRLRASIFFSKPSGELHDLSTWGKSVDGRGESPTSFGADNQIFILRNRSFFEADDRWSVTGAGSRIVVGDGNDTNRITLQLSSQGGASHPLYLNSNSLTTVTGNAPSIKLKDPNATLLLNNL